MFSQKSKYFQHTLIKACFWHRLDGSMPEGVEISNNTFAFKRPLERNDSGVYRCEVLNGVGLRSQDVNLWVQGASVPPLRSVTYNKCSF